jgi:protein-S-isoprenylcysteine O-methyltransferase Ste14
MFPKLCRWVYKNRGRLMVPFVAFAFLCTYGEIEEDAVVFGASGLLFAMGLALRVWAQVHIRRRLGREVSLTTSGPYAFTRNPLYIGNTIILVALTIMSELLWFAPVMLLWCALVYNLAVRYEESHLRQRFGAAYEEYMRTVPRWVPHFGLQSGERLSRLIWVEAPCLLLLLPPLVKEILN